MPMGEKMARNSLTDLSEMKKKKSEFLP